MSRPERLMAWAWVLASVATVIGLLAIWDSGYVRAAADGGMVPREFVSQGIATVLAVFAGLGCASVPPVFWKRFAPFAYGLGLVGLVAVKSIGKEINGAQRWIDLGFLNLQPSEFAKVAAVLFLAWSLGSRRPPKAASRRQLAWYESLDQVWLPRLGRAWPLLGVAVYVFLIEAEPDLATAMVIAVVALASLVVAGVRASSLVALGAVATLVVGVMVTTEPYRMDRILHHSSRREAGQIDSIGYQTTQSEAAMGRGGLLGVGLGEGKAKSTLPAPTTDFVATTIAEETGLVGALVVLAILGGLTATLWLMSAAAKDGFVKVTIAGIATWIGVQTCTNLMMTNGFLPPIGVPLPFVSAGGSSLIALWATLGMVQSLSRARQVEAEPVEARRDGWRHRRPRVSGA